MKVRILACFAILATCASAQTPADETPADDASGELARRAVGLDVGGLERLRVELHRQRRIEPKLVTNHDDLRG